MSNPHNLRIALLTDGFFPNVIGGMQKHSYYLAKYLAAAGIKVDLYYPAFHGKTDDLSGFSPAESQHISFTSVPYPLKGNSFGHYIREEYQFSIRMYKAVEKATRPDFIIAKGFTAWELLNQKSKGKSLPPVAVNFHGYEMFQLQPGFKAWLKSKLLFASPVKFNMQHADYLFSYGGKITTLLSNMGFGKKIIEVPSGISETWLQKTPPQHSSPKRFVFVGRFERRKGVEELNEALRTLRSAKVDFRFEFIGDIPSDKRIASDKIYYHGKIADEKTMQQLLQSADVLVCPSYSEGMPNVILEAMASGCAIITTDTGATSVMVDTTNGWFVPPGDAQSIADAIKQVIDLPHAELNVRRTASLKKIKDALLWERVAEKTIRAIEERLSKR